MLRQSIIQIDTKQIQSIHSFYKQKQEERKRLQEQSQQNELIEISKQIEEYSIVKEQIFPTQFTPFFIDSFTKESSLQLYEISVSRYQIQKVNERIKDLYQVLNNFTIPLHRQKLSHMLRIHEINHLVDIFSNHRQINILSSSNSYIPYFEEGKEMGKIQSWHFMHKEDKPNIAYDQREQLLDDLLLFFSFLASLIKLERFNTLALTVNDLLILQYKRANQYGVEYLLKTKLKWVYDLILGNHTIKTNEYNLVETAKIMVRKILCISEERQKRSKQEQIHFEQLEWISTFNDIIKLKYQEFYPYVRNQTLLLENKQKEFDALENSTEEMLLLRAEIHRIEELAKQELKNIKSTNKQPRIKAASEQQFWKQIKTYILKNITESERKAILIAKKGSSQNVKKGGKRPASILSKNTPRQGKQKQKLLLKPNQTQPQLVVQNVYLSSASDLKLRPEKLLNLIQSKQALLYVMKTINKKSKAQNLLGCYINGKAIKQSIGFFGSYVGDSAKKSFIYSQKNQKFYPLADKLQAVGYGPQIFLSIGKLDIIIPSFGTETVDGKQVLKCMSYFPVSYSSNGVDLNQLQDLQLMEKLQENNYNGDNNSHNINNGYEENLIGLQKEFFLEQIDIYQIKINSQ